MKKITLLLLTVLLSLAGYSQSFNADSAIKVINIKKDSALHALYHADSIRLAKEYGAAIKEAKIKGVAFYPVLNGGDGSGVVPVKDPTEIPDPTLDYKLMFELIQTNPDSLSKEIDLGLTEIVRVINLHVASGVPLKKIFPVIVVHGPALNVFTTNEYFKDKFKTDNPNIKLINDLAALGTKFIACGQAMYFMDIKNEAMLPLVKVSITAQTVLSSYRLKGYLKYW
jgi:intracellular sulfur oxidation DsrE/DsrF family protein